MVPSKQDLAEAFGADLGSNEELLESVQQVFAGRGIDSALEQAHFCAQVGHESGSLRYTEEIWGPTEAQKRYEPPSDLAEDLGNTEPGDGKRYKGRGLIQLTGQANYRRYNKSVGPDIVENPGLVAEPPLAADVAGWYWTTRSVGEIARQGSGDRFSIDETVLKRVTKAINGGYNGLQDRRQRLETAKETLMAPEVSHIEPATLEGLPT